MKTDKTNIQTLVTEDTENLIKEASTSVSHISALIISIADSKGCSIREAGEEVKERFKGSADGVVNLFVSSVENKTNTKG
ncbi:hypothetical protein [Bacillus toyonensis]|uniref:hypothetical protein n=1 Tax=Bacillus toyonensis TaxID=155322 RepID=UPI000BF366DA|nr:hypothetical protein [Bacillus toyonensis]PGF05004.1 hypothetical protein COM61_00785 [Bacillus toyonensis]